jgi:hypothetical protein
MPDIVGFIPLYAVSTPRFFESQECGERKAKPSSCMNSVREGVLRSFAAWERLH